MTDDFTYKPQDVHYLGFLEAQLRDMQGIPTLAYELIQNADDAPEDADGRFAPTTLRFHVNDDALIVENDSVFRPLDFARLQTIASGGKRQERGVTGAFGLGFLAVYQITDRPEIFSNGRHWTINPDAPAEQRIVERQLETDGTRFRLPWAFDPQTAVRRTLRLSAIQPAHLDDIAAELSSAIGLAALFLQRLHTLEVTRSGKLLRRITRRQTDNGRIILHEADGSGATWLLLSGSFNAAAEQLRSQFPWQIEAARRSAIYLALPLTGMTGPGRLFAGLPTATNIPLSLHISADFFPTTDRKRIHFDGGYQAAWNQAAITCAAETFAAALPELRDALSPQTLWQLLQQTAYTRELADQGDAPASLAQFWQTAVPILAAHPFIYTIHQTWALPPQTRLWNPAENNRRPPDNAAADLLARLNIPLVHPDLNSVFPLLRRPEIGAPDLQITDIAAALAQLGLTRPTALADAPPPLNSLDAWLSLWRILDDLYGRLIHAADREIALNALAACALILSDNLIVQKPGRVYQGTPESQALFPDVPWLHPQTPREQFPGRLAPRFGARQAVERVANTSPEQLQADWQTGRLDIARLFRWLEGQQIEIFADDPRLRGEIRRLPLCPVDGELRPLNHLYLPGGFTDPLKLAGLIDLEAVGGRRQFFLDLGMEELDFYTYVEEVMPRILAENPDVPSDARHRLTHLLAERMGELRDDEELQERLAHLPLVACLDGSFRAATAVYTDREATALLGDKAHVAEPVESQAVEALYRWLGVRAQPDAADLVAALTAISQQTGDQDAPLPPTVLAQVTRCWSRLADLYWQSAATAASLTPLHGRAVIPNSRGMLVRAEHLFLADDAALVAQFAGGPDGPAADFLLPPTAPEVGVWAALGVRPLSQAIQQRALPVGPQTPDPRVTQRLAERGPLINRLLRAEVGPLETQPLIFVAPQVVKTPKLLAQVWLPIGETGLATVPQAAAAKWMKETAVLYLAYEGDDVPWTAVARELAQVLKGERAAASLALGLKEVLTAASATAAARILDELGYN